MRRAAQVGAGPPTAGRAVCGETPGSTTPGGIYSLTRATRPAQLPSQDPQWHAHWQPGEVGQGKGWIARPALATPGSLPAFAPGSSPLEQQSPPAPPIEPAVQGAPGTDGTGGQRSLGLLRAERVWLPPPAGRCGERSLPGTCLCSTFHKSLGTTCLPRALGSVFDLST